MLTFDPNLVPSPSYVIDLDALEANARVFGRIADASGAKVLLALKAFGCTGTFDLLRPYFAGTCASGPFEAKLGAEHFGGETHAYAPAFSETSLGQTLPHVSAISFNSLAQWHRFRPMVEAEPRRIQCGLRVNPECSSSPEAKYDPCAEGSRLGIRAEQLQDADLGGISGLAFHALCEADSQALERVIAAFERRFGDLIGQVDWINFGGGHMATRDDYDVDHLIHLLTAFRDRHPGVELIIEPGEAVGYNAGHLVATVLDLLPGERPTAILDTSATAHTPDVLEMPYQPEIVGASCDPSEFPHRYTLGCPTCLAADVFGEYSFPAPLEIGQRIAFTDMAHYTMVKNNTFNGIPLPAIVHQSEAKGLEVAKEFGYEDFRGRLA